MIRFLCRWRRAGQPEISQLDGSRIDQVSVAHGVVLRERKGMLTLGQLINQDMHQNGGWEPASGAERVELHSVCHLDSHLIVNSVGLGSGNPGAEYLVVNDLASNNDPRLDRLVYQPTVGVLGEIGPQPRHGQTREIRHGADVPRRRRGEEDAEEN